MTDRFKNMGSPYYIGEIMVVKGWTELRKVCSRCKSMTSPLSSTIRGQKCGRCGGDYEVKIISATDFGDDFTRKARCRTVPED